MTSNKRSIPKIKREREKMEKAVYTVEEVKSMLGIGLCQTYELIHSKNGPPVIRVGRRLLVPVDGFKAWLSDQSRQGARV